MLSEKGQSQNGHTLLKYIYIAFSKKNIIELTKQLVIAKIYEILGERCVYKDKKVT